MTVPVIPSLPIIGHSLPFQRNALKFISEMQEKYGRMFVDINTKKDENAIYYFPVFVIRRFVFIMTPCVSHESL